VGVTQGRFGVVIEQLPGGDQVPCHHVGGGTVQRAQLAPDLGGQLPGVDVLRYRRPSLGCAFAVGRCALRLGLAGPAGTRPAGLPLGAWPSPLGAARAARARGAARAAGAAG
jgi:hypothetical protein